MRDEVKQSIKEAYIQCGFEHPPNPMQEEMYCAVASDDCAVLLKAPTGRGKTEAVVIPALCKQRRLVLIYPALSLIEDQEARIEKLVQHISMATPDRPRSLIVDTGAAMYRRHWLSGVEQKKVRRHLYDGDIILTTLDKFLYRFFGFGEPQKSNIYPLRMRYGRQILFCFDEAHSYDEVAYTNFVDLVRAIGYNVDAPRDVIVMTATMSPTYEQDLLPLLTPVDYTTGQRALSLAQHYTEAALHLHPEKAFSYHPVTISKEDDFCTELLALLAAQHRPEQRTIITVEKVETAITLYRRLLDEKGMHGLLYHGRLPHRERKQVYAELKQREEDQQEYVLITTSAIEVGCDLDAHLLMTQLCNPEQLVQRAGRCNRKGTMENARILVVGDHIPNYLSTIAEEDMEPYQYILQEMTRQNRFETTELIAFRHKRGAPDYRVQTLFTMLYEYVYLAERANRSLHEKGLVVTRSWEPTVTLTTGWNEKQELQNELQISMLRCTARNDAQIDGQCEIFVRHYDEKESCYKLEPPHYGGWAYHQDIIIRVPDTYMDPVLGYEHVPKVFLRGGRQQSYRRGLYALIEKPPAVPTTQQEVRKGTKKTAKKELKTEPADLNIPMRGKVWWWYIDKLPSVEESTQQGEFDKGEEKQQKQEEVTHE